MNMVSQQAKKFQRKSESQEREHKYKLMKP